MIVRLDFLGSEKKMWLEATKLTLDGAKIFLKTKNRNDSDKKIEFSKKNIDLVKVEDRIVYDNNIKNKKRRRSTSYDSYRD